MKKITLLLSLMLGLLTTHAQLSLQTGTANYTINFNGTVAGVNAGSYAGTGFRNSPSSGQLDADAWATTGFSDGAKGFGASRTSGDHARGLSSGGVSSGGLYSFNVGSGNRALGIQPTGSDWTPGTITLKIVNNSNVEVTAITVGYRIYYRNDQNRASTLNLSYSTNNSNYTGVSSANYTSPQGSGSSSWVSTDRSAQLTGLSLDPGASFYIRWSSNDAGGSGSRDELALDNISITTTSASGGGNNGGGNTGYYASIGTETCADLKTALYDLIKGHSRKSYNSLWTHYKTTDDRRNDANTKTILWDMYSDNPSGSENEFTLGADQCGTFAGEGSCYNREHTFPKSWWGGSTSPSQYTDLFTVVPVDGWVNSVRNNYPYGEVLAGTENQISNNGSKLGSSAIAIPGYSGKVFEPIDAYKGDLARGYFYMATRYENVIGNWENITLEANAVLDGSSFPVYEDWLIDMLMDWHNSDPVSQKEIDRNEAIFGIQGNRNPFIDHPEYVDLIWGTCGGNNGGTPTVLHEAYFESGWDGWSDGGSDCARTSSSRTPQGNYSIYIRDNSGSKSAMTSPTFDLRGYNSVQIDFSFYAYSMETNEDFWLSYYNGSSYQIVKAYKRGTDFNNNKVYNFSITLDDNNYNFVSNARFRFQCDASSNADLIYMDAIVITGTPAGNAYQAILTEGPAPVSNLEDKTVVAPAPEQSPEVRKEKVASTIAVYPNPTNDLVFVDLRTVNGPQVQVELYSVTGQKMLPTSLQATGDIATINLVNLPKGMYFLRIIADNQLLQTQKVLLR